MKKDAMTTTYRGVKITKKKKSFRIGSSFMWNAFTSLTAAKSHIDRMKAADS